MDAIKSNKTLLFLFTLYGALYGICVFANINSKEFMTIDENSIVSSLEQLTTSAFYNMNATYHSQFYGWTYFSLNFVLISILNVIGVDSEIGVNFSIRVVGFVIGLIVITLFYKLTTRNVTRTKACILTAFFIVNPVTAHFFNEIHPEMLGVLFQLAAVGVFYNIYVDKKNIKGDFYLAILFLSLSCLSKQAFVVANTFIALSFFILYHLEVKKLQLREFIKIIFFCLIVFFSIFFIIHPYAFIEFDKFFEAQRFISEEHSSKSFDMVIDRWIQEIIGNPLVLINFLLLFSLLWWRKLPLSYNLSVVFCCLVTSIYVYKSRLWVTDGYFFPIYAFYFFNIFYFINLTCCKIDKKFRYLILFTLSLVFLSNLSVSIYEQQKRFFLQSTKTKNIAWEYLKDLPGSKKVAYSPNIAMPNNLRGNGCHAWQGCNYAKDLEKYDPDIIVYSPSYPHFNSQEFLHYIDNNNMRLIKEINSSKSSSNYSCQNPSYSKLYVFDYFLLYQNISSCIGSYINMLDNYTTQSVVTGLDIEIYENN
ncbi:glycosyltransferase family 39 protein [Vibrio crassostreae]|uniref:Dolichyl-phosphate-mannose-protein mannosyltransferase n=2 Tax=Vibrio crassostreae TaxID=246167 RepID=A0ABP1WU10_9VIBR|nr:glycosyltransferase family 39 protein [Vibrio crassostreae]TCL27592.1 dolichyl-phosphate-mannose-protein mannosyltransferase [Vibrio crassostreae]TCT48967.1 dolichyl-phosphate-mannose-protein mannosyltransferase [Vibrio crassostreae]TCT58610.1 dolichyl-phosphate-mannose-protein mannosyltransferase [Vibrio crassostreae]CAK1704960.1 putative Glycosyltransferase RgtA/B/C/D-like domain-containing protein [Vibrio crassostreae]CAK1706825.1 putative Glycosyltransferase RgtA/B/C/D-like domain-conta